MKSFIISAVYSFIKFYKLLGDGMIIFIYTIYGCGIVNGLI